MELYVHIYAGFTWNTVPDVFSVVISFLLPGEWKVLSGYDISVSDVINEM